MINFADMTGNELKARREKLKRRDSNSQMRQEDLARELDVTVATVARWEQLRDETIPNSKILEFALDSLERELAAKAEEGLH